MIDPVAAARGGSIAVVSILPPAARAPPTILPSALSVIAPIARRELSIAPAARSEGTPTFWIFCQPYLLQVKRQKCMLEVEELKRKQEEMVKAAIKENEESELNVLRLRKKFLMSLNNLRLKEKNKYPHIVQIQYL